MGDWGYGPFESDQALDFVGNLFEWLFEAIAKDLETAMDDGRLIRHTLAAVKIVQTLSESFSFFKDCALLEKRTVKNWKPLYMEWLDYLETENILPRESVNEMRATAKEVFAELYRTLEFPNPDDFQHPTLFD